jgi:hypothetical protein
MKSAGRLLLACGSIQAGAEIPSSEFYRTPDLREIFLETAGEDAATAARNAQRDSSGVPSGRKTDQRLMRRLGQRVPDSPGVAHDLRRDYGTQDGSGLSSIPRVDEAMLRESAEKLAAFHSGKKDQRLYL